MADVSMPKDFGFGSDEEMLRDLARKLLREEMPIEKLRRLVAADPKTVYDEGQRPSWDEALWKQCVELGWTGLAVPEDVGGVGISLVGIAALLEEVGRAALPSPLVPTLNATFALRAAGSAEANAWLSRIADGATASLAVTDETGSWGPQPTDVRMLGDGDGVTMSCTVFVGGVAITV